MNTDELVATVRRVGLISPNDPVHTADEILAEATQAMRDRFAAPLQLCRQGYWLKEATATTVPNRANYKIPANTLVQGLEKLEISIDGTNYRELLILTQPQATSHMGTGSGEPTYFTLESDQVRLWPPPASVYTLRFVFYLQPPTLMPFTACRITLAFGVQLFVDTDPAAMTPPITTTSGFYIQNKDGSHEIPNFEGQVSTITGAGPYLITSPVPLAGGSRVQIGDYVTPAGYSVFPMLPLELHRPLCDYTAGIIWVSKGDRDKATMLTQKAETGINRFVEMAVSRVKARPFTWKRSHSYLRRHLGG